MTAGHLHLNVNVDTVFAATFDGLVSAIGEKATERLSEQSLLRSFSHAVDPDADPHARWTGILVFTTQGEGDIPLDNAATTLERFTDTGAAQG